MKRIVPILFCVAVAMAAGRADAGLDDVVYEAIENDLGPPTSALLMKRLGVWEDADISPDLDVLFGKINRQSKNRRGKRLGVLRGGGVNAVAVPGGDVFIMGGLAVLLRNEDQYACIVGHEVAHLERRHSAKAVLTAIGLDAINQSLYSRNEQERERLAGQFVSLLFERGFSRKDEYEADELGLKYAAAAGYDPRQCLAAMEIIEKIEGGGRRTSLLATHPPTRDRIERMRKLIGEMGEAYAAAPVEPPPWGFCLAADPEAIRQSGYNSYMEGDYEAALTSYRKSSEMKVDNFTDMRYIAASSLALGDFREAKKQVKVIVASFAPRTAAEEIYYAGFEKLLERMEEAGAIPAAEPFAEAADRDAEAGREKEAGAGYFAALLVKPGETDWCYNLAVSLENLGEKDPALEYYRASRRFSTAPEEIKELDGIIEELSGKD